MDGKAGLGSRHPRCCLYKWPSLYKKFVKLVKGFKLVVVPRHASSNSTEQTALVQVENEVGESSRIKISLPNKDYLGDEPIRNSSERECSEILKFVINYVDLSPKALVDVRKALVDVVKPLVGLLLNLIESLSYILLKIAESPIYAPL
jgi:hypothetical protein